MEPLFIDAVKVFKVPVPDIVPLLIIAAEAVPLLSKVIPSFTVIVLCAIVLDAALAESPLKTRAPVPVIVPVLSSAEETRPLFVNEPELIIAEALRTESESTVIVPNSCIVPATVAVTFSRDSDVVPAT